MDQVDAVGLQSQEAAHDAVEQRFFPPILDARPLRMAALGEQEILLAAIADGLPDQLLAGQIALGRVDDIQAGVQRGC